MSRKTHLALQVCLLVVCILILWADTSVIVSSQTCTQPGYMWENPLRKYWRPNFGGVVVKIDSRFATQYPAAPDAQLRISAGHQMWNDVTCSGVTFTDFGQRSFTLAEYDNTQPPSGQVWWMVSDPGNGFNGGVASHYGIDDRVISADVKITPDLVVPDPVYFNYLGTHEIGHTFNLGFSLTDAYSGVMFDMGGDGHTEPVAWTVSNTDDAWLAYDRNGNGLIDSGKELFGNFTDQPHATKSWNGFLALAEFDLAVNGGNHDGIISKNDAVFSSLLLWQDVNRNGISERSEFHTLKELGVRTIELAFKESKQTDEYGNKFRYRAKVKDNNDAQLGRWAWDVILQANPPKRP